MLNKRRRLLHSSRVKLPFVNVSASWCLVSTCSIWIFGSRLILSTNQVLDRCLSLLDFCLWWSFKSLLRCLQKCRASHQIEKTSRSMEHNRHCLIQDCRAELESWPRNSFPFTLLLDFFYWLGEELNTSIAKSKRSRAGIPSMRKPASREITSASAERCETEVCFLHIQLIGANLRLPNMHTSPPEIDFESSRSPAKSESWKQSQPALLCSASHMTLLFEFTRMMKLRKQTC